MASSFLLAGGLGSLALAIVMLTLAAVPAGPRRAGSARTLQAIERHYVRRVRPADDEGTERLPQSRAWLHALGRRLSPSTAIAGLQHKLDMAGNPPRWDTDRVLGAKGLGLLALGGLGALYGLNKPAVLVPVALLGAAIGFYLPDLLVYNAGLKRQTAIAAALPDAIDMLTVCVEAGLGFDAALSRVAVNSEGPFAAELRRALQEMQIGVSRTEALRSLADRTTVTELRALVSSLVQAGEMGVPIADVLREQARELRLRRRQRAEELAQKVPVKILLPLIGCLFPALFVMVLGPGILAIAHSLFHK